MAIPKELVGVGFAPMQATGMGGTYNAVTAAGSSQADAAAIASGLTVVASADGTKGVILPAVEAGSEVDVFNNSGSTLKVYPDGAAAISVAGTGLGSASTAFSQLTYKYTKYKRVTSTQWLALTTA